MAGCAEGAAWMGGLGGDGWTVNPSSLPRYSNVLYTSSGAWGLVLEAEELVVTGKTIIKRVINIYSVRT